MYCLVINYTCPISEKFRESKIPYDSLHNYIGIKSITILEQLLFFKWTLWDLYAIYETKNFYIVTIEKISAGCEQISDKNIATVKH